MLTVILGAGASYDSVPRSENLRPYSLAPEYRPPLAADLFSPREPFAQALAGFNELLPLVNTLRRAVSRGRSIEEVLEELESEAPSYPYRYTQLLAIRIYIQTVVSECASRWVDAAYGATNYHELVDELERWRQQTGSGPVTYVTFNYDCLLEAALTVRFGYGFSEMRDYVNRGEYRVLKLHGSTD